jgi:hypothetical protein
MHCCTTEYKTEKGFYGNDICNLPFFSFAFRQSRNLAVEALETAYCARAK